MRPIVRGNREFLYDDEGAEYIDAISGVYNASYGHCHPRITGVLRRPILLNCYDNPTSPRSALEGELKQLTGFNEVHLFSSGAETVEKALQLAMRSLPSGRRGVCSFRGGFHGKTMGTLSLFDTSLAVETSAKSPYPFCQVPPPGMRFEDGASTEDDVLSSIESALTGSCGIVILEPVMGYFGYEFDRDFLRRLKRLCNRTRSILIFDEMITSFGRTGENFVSDYIMPHVLVVGKGLGQGLPIMAVMYDEMNNGGTIRSEGFSFTTATANSPLLCAVGWESCRILVEESMSKAAGRTGNYLRGGLREYGAITGNFDVHGIGAMTFLKSYGTVCVSNLERDLRERFILTRAHGDTLVLMPPFVISEGSMTLIMNGILHGIRAQS